jgi:energy-coupling factor transporter ATP-binding protein EcfA2
MKPPEPDIYFDARSGTYWLKLPHTPRFLNLDGRNVKLHLMRGEFRIDPEDDFGLKAGDRVLTTAQLERWVDYAGPLSGHGIGIVNLNAGGRILVTSAAYPVEPAKKSDCPMLERFMAELFGAEQADVVLYWLKCARESLAKRDFRPGQLLVLAGPSGCGKSLFQSIVTLLLGGRSAKPYRYMIGETQFNSDLAGAEHLVIEDENASADIRSRRKFGASIKEFTVNTEMSVHAKGRQAITLPTFKRMTLSVNDEPENLMILPPMDGSLLDKVTLLKCSPATIGEDREQTWKTITNEVPALCRHLSQIRVPARLKDARFGVKAYHHPDILELLCAISPEQRLLNLIDEVLFTRRSGEDAKHFEERVGDGWQGTAEQLEREIRDPASGFGFAVDKLLYFASACGTYLARLASQQPERFIQKRSKGKSFWTIARGGSE